MRHRIHTHTRARHVHAVKGNSVLCTYPIDLSHINVDVMIIKWRSYYQTVVYNVYQYLNLFDVCSEEKNY